ncbi:MAG: Xaa-Pro peptidase family protein [Dehalococcoidia bacterium]
MDYKGYLKELLSKPIPKELAFPVSEYQQRTAKVRGFMGEEDLDTLIVSFINNVCYLSGYQAFAADLPVCLVLPQEGDPTLAVMALEIPGAPLNGWFDDVRGMDWMDADSVADELVAILKEKGLESGRIGVETKRSGMTIDVYERLKRALPEARFVDASGLVVGARKIKSPAELDHMRQAAKISIKGIEAGLAAIKAGVTENDVASPAFQAMVSAGSEYFSSQPIVTAAHRTGWVHTSFKRTPILTGHTVILEFGGAYQRYTCGIMHTAIVGPPSDPVRRLAEISNGALDLLFQVAKPGRTAHDVASDVKKGLKGIGDEIYTTGMFGYSIGLGFPPTWREMINFVAEGNDEPLEPGMTFHSPIPLRVPGILGVGFSETWAVTETGCEVLTKHDRSLYVAPA